MERKLELTNLLKGDIGELIYEHYSIQNQYAYLKTEEIYKDFRLSNILKFRHGWERITVKVPALVEEEIRKFARPSNNNEENPSFVFDYLSMSLKMSFDYDESRKIHLPRPYLSEKAFKWNEIKTGKSYLSENQEKQKKETKLGVYVFRINFDEANLDRIKIEDIVK